MNAFLDGLDDSNFATDSKRGAFRPQAEPQTFPCQSCAGTGLWRGRGACFACKGAGKVNKSAADMFRAKQARAASKVKAAEALVVKLGAFEEQNPGLVLWMFNNMSWSSFIADMHNAVLTRGALTDNQLDAVLRTKAKCDVRRAEKQAARTVEVDLGAIHAMFDKARESGLKRLAYRAEGLVLSPANNNSANAGAIYVKAGETYLGKVVGTSFIATRDATDEHKATIAKIAENPAEVAKSYGIRTGTCSCCGRELTDKNSIELGIGPICAEKWGF